MDMISKELLEKKYADLTAALQSVMSDFPDVMVFDRSHNTSTTVKLKDKILYPSELSSPRSYSETWNRYISSYVTYEDRSRLLMSVENETIYSTISQEGSYSHDYRIIYKGTPMLMQVVFVLIHAEKDYLIFGFKNIT